MISFRFHLISLTAVFLALAIGIGVGASVVDRATVDRIDGTLKTVRKRANETNRENDRLRADLATWSRFGDQGADTLVRGRLANIPVLVVGVQGTDRRVLDGLRASLAAAGARLQGYVSFSSKLKLDTPNDLRELEGIVGVTAGRADTLRRIAATRLAEAFSGGGAATLLPALRDAKFLDYEAPSGEPVDLAALPLPATYFVVVSSASAEVPNDQVAAPFATSLAGTLPSRVVAVEPGRAAQGKQPEVRAVFLRPLREDPDVSARLSTVDNAEDVRGRVATVYSVAALLDGKTGHFGVGRGATRLLPEASP